MGKNTANKSSYAASLASAFALAIFSPILFDDSGYPFNLVFALLYFVVLFSPLGQILLKQFTNYIRVLTVATLAIITSVLVGLMIPSKIAQYYDKRAALAPGWLYPLTMFFLIGSIITGLVFAYMIFKKYDRE